MKKEKEKDVHQLNSGTNLLEHERKRFQQEEDSEKSRQAVSESGTGRHGGQKRSQELFATGSRLGLSPIFY